MPNSAEFAVEPTRSISAIDSWLPQTQCTRCGYPRCRDYAAALYRGETELNRCPPGGEQSIAGLARLLGSEPLPLNPECGTHQPRVLAVIIEEQCIGCKLCIQACPVDAIIGRAKRMHTVLPLMCTGCELCLPACPVDCIKLIEDSIHPAGNESRWPEYAGKDVRLAHRNTVIRLRRLQTTAQQTQQTRNTEATAENERIRAEIQAAVKRVKQKHSQK